MLATRAQHNDCIKAYPDVCVECMVWEQAHLLVMQVRQAFSMKRKMLRNSLQPLYTSSDIAEAMTAAGMSAEIRPQQLSFAEYVMLYKALQTHSDPVHQ